jgi:hypothetical protein
MIPIGPADRLFFFRWFSWKLTNIMNVTSKFHRTLVCVYIINICLYMFFERTSKPWVQWSKEARHRDISQTSYRDMYFKKQMSGCQVHSECINQCTLC